MDSHLEAEVLAASQPLVVPGAGELRVLSPISLARLAQAASCPRWEVEALALEAGVVPLHYLRNQSRFPRDDQVRLLRSRVGMVGAGAVVEVALGLLAQAGVGTFRILVPALTTDEAPVAEMVARGLTKRVENGNASCAVEAAAFSLGGGNPVVSLQGLAGVCGSLGSSMDEQLLQGACRLARVGLVLGAAEGSRAQAFAVLPGDAGTAAVYRPRHPHLEPRREPGQVHPRTALVVGTWLAEQVICLLLGKDELLRGRLQYADLETGEMAQYRL